MALGVPEFRRALLNLSAALDGDVSKLTAALARFDIVEALRYITDAYPELVTPYLAAGGDLSATWYEDNPAAIGAKPFLAQPAELPEVDQLAVNGRWALTQSDPSTETLAATTGIPASHAASRPACRLSPKPQPIRIASGSEATLASQTIRPSSSTTHYNILHDWDF